MPINFSTDFSSPSGTASSPITLDLNKNSSPLILDLNKTSASPLHNIRISLIWDPVYGDQPFDLDLSSFTLTNGKVTSINDICYFKKLNIGYIHHSDDSLTGADASGDDEDEYMIINLDAVPASANSIEILVNVFDAKERKQTFGSSRSKVIISNDDTKKVLATLNLSDDFFADTMVDAAVITRSGNGWNVVTKGKGYTLDLQGMLNFYA